MAGREEGGVIHETVDIDQWKSTFPLGRLREEVRRSVRERYIGLLLADIEVESFNPQTTARATLLTLWVGASPRMLSAVAP